MYILYYINGTMSNDFILLILPAKIFENGLDLKETIVYNTNVLFAGNNKYF